MTDILLMRPETDWRLYPTVFGCTLLVFGMIDVNRWAFVKAALVTVLLYFVPMILCGSAMLCLVLAFGFAELRDRPRAPVANPSPGVYTYDNPRASIEGAVVTKINEHTVQIDAKGMSFLLWRERDGTAIVQRLNKEGQTYGSKVSGAPNAWQFGMTIDQSLAEYVKRVINQKGEL